MMSSTWPDDLSTVCGSTWQPIEDQVNYMHEVIEAERGDNNLAIIAVVSEECLYELSKKSQKRWWQFWKGKSMVLVTTSDWLQDTIRDVRRDGRRKTMVIMASTDVTHITFKVRSSIKTLKVLRCGHYDDPEGCLIINGSATFAGARMDEWHSSRPKRRDVYLGKGVCIQVDSDTAPSWLGSTDSLSYEQRQIVRGYMQRMQNTNMKGCWWKKWRSLIAGFLGVVITSVKLAAGFKASASGVFVNFKLGTAVLQAGAFKASLSAIATAAGPAVLLGASATACVYFIPWEDLFVWLRGAFGTLWDWITSLWSKLKIWLDTRSKSRNARAGPMFS